MTTDDSELFFLDLGWVHTEADPTLGKVIHHSAMYFNHIFGINSVLGAFMSQLDTVVSTVLGVIF